MTEKLFTGMLASAQTNKTHLITSIMEWICLTKELLYYNQCHYNYEKNIKNGNEIFVIFLVFYLVIFYGVQCLRLVEFGLCD